MRFRERPSRKHDYQVFRTEANNGVRGKQRNSFYFCTASTWNDLPSSVVDSTTVKAFKNNLDAHWEDDQAKFVFDAVPYYYTEEL